MQKKCASRIQTQILMAKIIARKQAMATIHHLVRMLAVLIPIHPRSGLDMRAESNQNWLQNHTNPKLTILGLQTFVRQYVASMKTACLMIAFLVIVITHLFTVQIWWRKTRNILHQQSFSTVDHVPSGQYISDYSTQTSAEESGVPASLQA